MSDYYYGMRIKMDFRQLIGLLEMTGEQFAKSTNSPGVKEDFYRIASRYMFTQPGTYAGGIPVKTGAFSQSLRMAPDNTSPAYKYGFASKHVASGWIDEDGIHLDPFVDKSWRSRATGNFFSDFHYGSTIQGINGFDPYGSFRRSTTVRDTYAGILYTLIGKDINKQAWCKNQVKMVIGDAKW